ncbi:hypothetical protein IWZ01DRAFT_561208 [Phyllosticta capitalensis]|uniref:Uncharacterized protein n=1 Tax=Phyllosticta capitalensis TaxID=121624 RepID=A0ABR1YBH0_9PEZI
MRYLVVAAATAATAVAQQQLSNSSNTQISFPFPASDGDDVADYLGSVITVQGPMTTMKVECKDYVTTGSSYYADDDTVNMCYFTDPVTMTLGPSTFAFVTEYTGDGGTVDLTVSSGCSIGSSLVCAVSEGGPGAWADVCYQTYIGGNGAFSNCLTANSGTVPISTTTLPLSVLGTMTITVTDGGQSLTAGASVVAATATATSVAKNSTSASHSTGYTTRTGPTSSRSTQTAGAAMVTGGIALANVAGLVMAGLL